MTITRYSAAQQQAIRRFSRAAIGLFDLAQELDDIWANIEAGAVGITADASSVDAVAKNHGTFEQDVDTTTGLTLGYKAFRFNNGLVNISVSSGTVLLATASTNYVEVDRSGAVSANTSGFTSGRLPLASVVTGASSITTVTASQPMLTLIGSNAINGVMLSADAKTKVVELLLGDISATGSFAVLPPSHACTLARATIVNTADITASDTDYWTFAIENKATDGNGTDAMLAATDPNTTKATGGSALADYAARVLTLHGTPANLDVLADETLQFTATATGSPTTLAGCVLRLEFTFTG